MSQPPFSTPFEAAALMLQTVVWEAFLGFDGHAQPSYVTSKTLLCRQESPSILGLGGLTAIRQADQTVVNPAWVLIFSGDNEDAQTFTMFDRFTPNSIGDIGSEPLQPLAINSMHGPNFDSTNHWAIVVLL